MATRYAWNLGPCAPTVQAALEQMKADDVIRRLLRADPSLWAGDPAGQAAVANRLGWLAVPRVMAGHLAMITRTAAELREAGYSHALVLGMGGSGMFPEVCRHTFGVGTGCLDLAVLDSTDPAAVTAAQRRGMLERTVIVVSSKSGTTSEIQALCAYFYEALKALGPRPGERCLAITDAGTPLEAQARALGFRRIFAHGPGTGAEVGGRFAALTCFGLVPAALMGVDVAELLQRAEETLERCAPDAMNVSEPPAARLGAMLGSLAAQGRDKLTLVFGPAQERFGIWLEQLIAESLGKQGRGLVPILGEPRKDAGAYGPDRVFVTWRLATRRDEELERWEQTLEQAGHPLVRIDWDEAYDLGGEVITWSLATAIAGALMEINPFDEPDVKAAKDRTALVLERFTRDGRWPEPSGASCSGEGVSLYAATAPCAERSPAAWLHAFLRALRPGEYLGLLSFLPRTAAVDHAVSSWRARLSERLAVPTLLEIGPRYLHSTGQLYKGGPDTGAFLLLTAEESDDLPIPGQPFGLGVLKQAQALGDFDAMQQRHRRILRLHLTAPVEQALPRLDRLFAEATRSDQVYNTRR